MHKPLIPMVMMIVMIYGTPQAQIQVPREIAGFVLGAKIESCEAHLQMETVMPLRYQPYLREVQIKAMGGFKTGLITFEQCAQPGRIVRIKMKYADSSKAFFQKLLKRYKSRFGSDPEWKGDPFHITLAWKWSFVDDQGNHIILILQHNIKDEEEKRGNSVKLTLFNALEEAKTCYKSQQTKASPSSTPQGPVDWDKLIPR